MKILLTGGGTGGHFYPVIAIAQELNQIAEERKLLQIELFYMASKPYDERLLFENNLQFVKVPAGKMRRYFSLLNIFDFFKTAIGVIKAVWGIFLMYPDVVFGKGGYDSFPAILAARLFFIPVVIHESDTVPGKVNAWAGKFARRIAVTFPEAGEKFKRRDVVAFTGNPIRKTLYTAQRGGAREFLQLEEDVPIILFLGGSQGAQTINQHLLDTLPQLVTKYQVIHQTGRDNLTETQELASVILEKHQHRERYKPYAYLNDLALKMVAGSAELVVSRAGAGTISELALWGIPSILIPIPESISHDQRANAFAYQRTGSCIVIEEQNLSANVLFAQIENLMNNKKERERMKLGALSFAKPDAARIIAEELISIALEHEQ
ncbi:MAG: UDP diphospho-muramoyl pentapeptide beta-N acetylglucosaminyl transferase [Parcubacteria group bacterium Gr01-1014_48]|nr:MAG: UDP diphospho-muramoyl pentapeptide beta-N acetylglucosaminyl transferase [Parcubacteria group bacterium Greene0416_14]TSC74143.1 MAG: UDP diphospho-muramoyl pentapeptide beta-N acetylglucosaminyl transferase [Parcubacteria group bacterium Gr01-1014_48]TSD01700.1 MAG: UDP diphospho-muramoyl pentapeptide beta-N acetylglucosaminyl transferase [Parcubacteria group bacterium Greene1014_15]TSD08166.1 MAG: UDP diphospho-muramoyl pentapeptide beta-N acetylglucosaminyl transferase [Parcubacteria